MPPQAPVFGAILADYLARIEGLPNPADIAARLGVAWEDGRYRIPFFERGYAVEARRMADESGAPPGHAVAVILAKYLLLCPARPAADPTLVSYRDFRDSAPYVGGFHNTAERPVARHFGGRTEDLRQQCRQMGGQPFPTDAPYQLAFRFQALPRVPVFLLFNDADADFPAQATVLFQRDAAGWLDMECLAMVGGVLAARLAGDG